MRLKESPRLSSSSPVRTSAFPSRSPAATRCVISSSVAMGRVIFLENISAPANVRTMQTPRSSRVRR